jgi:hypothetical protein
MMPTQAIIPNASTGWWRSDCLGRTKSQPDEHSEDMAAWWKIVRRRVSWTASYAPVFFLSEYDA